MKNDKLKNLFNLVSFDGISSDCAFDMYNTIDNYEPGGFYSLANLIAENGITKASEIPKEELVGAFEKVWSITESKTMPNFDKALDFMITTALNYSNYCTDFNIAIAHSKSAPVRARVSELTAQCYSGRDRVSARELKSAMPGFLEEMNLFFRGNDYPNPNAPGIAISLMSTFEFMALYYSSKDTPHKQFKDVSVNGRDISEKVLYCLLNDIFNSESVIDFSRYGIQKEDLARISNEVVRAYAITDDAPECMTKVAMHDLILKPGTYLSEAAKSLNGILLKEFDKFDECRKPNPHTSDFEGDSVDFRYSFAHYFPGTVPSHLSVSKASPVAESDVEVDNSRQEAKEMTNGEAAEFLNELFINNKTLDKPVKLTSAAIMMLFNVTGVKITLGYDLVWGPTPKLYRTLRMSWLLA